jgi:phosphatidylglycerophosphatase C
VKKIAFFDFDGTITSHDTMIELAKFHSGTVKFIIGMVALSPWLLGMKLKLVSKQNAKEKLLSLFFKGLTLLEFQELCNEFIKLRLPSIIRPLAIQTIKQLQNNNFQVVVVSASADNWVKPWCDSNNIIFIGSCLDVIDNKITGKLNGPNCNYDEKVNRIREKYQLSDFSEIHCYGDTKGDKAMLQLATHSYYKPFRSHINS